MYLVLYNFFLANLYTGAGSRFLPWGGGNLPECGEIIVCYPLPLSVFFSYTTLLIYAYFFDILNTCYQEIYKIYFITFFLFVIGSGGGSKCCLNAPWNRLCYTVQHSADWDVTKTLLCVLKSCFASLIPFNYIVEESSIAFPETELIPRFLYCLQNSYSSSLNFE